MTIDKEHKEFHAVDMNEGWHVPPGYPDGIQQKILAGSLDEDKKTGNRTRLLRFDAGVYTTSPFVHDYWEEVYLVSGDLTVGNDKQGNGGIVALGEDSREDLPSFIIVMFQILPLHNIDCKFHDAVEGSARTLKDMVEVFKNLFRLNGQITLTHNPVLLIHRYLTRDKEKLVSPY